MGVKVVRNSYGVTNAKPPHSGCKRGWGELVYLAACIADTSEKLLRQLEVCCNFMNMDKGYFFSLDAEGIKEYFQEKREETSQLEFKRGDTALKNIYKEITAFANTNGGTLVLGSPNEESETKDDIEYKYCKGEIIPCMLTMTEDDMLSSVRSNIAPSPIGIEVKRIKLIEGCVYIFNVPKSNLKPHQYNFRYYTRWNTMSQPAEHAFVEMMFNQKLEIDLELSIKTSPALDKRWLDIIIALKNKTNIPAEKVELYFSMVGKVHQAIDDDTYKLQGDTYKLPVKRLSNGYKQISKIAVIPHSVIDKIYAWYTAMDIRIYENDYVYLEVIFWARGVPAKSKYYRVFKNTTIEPEEIKPSSPEMDEFEEWQNS